MSQMKDFYLAGLLVEEAREKRDAARASLREVAAVKCPEELAALESASAALEEAEKQASMVFTAMVTGKTMNETDMKNAMDAHIRNCDNPNCTIKHARNRANGNGGNGEGQAN